MLFVTLFKGSISRGPLDLKGCLLLIGCCLVSSFVQNPLSVSKRWVCHFFSLWKLTFLKFVVGFLTFVVIFVEGISKFIESHNKLRKCQFFEQKKVTNPPLWNWRGFCTKLDTRQQPIRSKHTFRSKGPLEIKPLKRVTKSIIVTKLCLPGISKCDNSAE